MTNRKKIIFLEEGNYLWRGARPEEGRSAENVRQSPASGIWRPRLESWISYVLWDSMEQWPELFSHLWNRNPTNTFLAYSQGCGEKVSYRKTCWKTPSMILTPPGASCFFCCVLKCVCKFPMTSVTNYHKLGNYHKLNSIQIYYFTVLVARSPKSVSLVQNQSVSRATCSLEAQGKNPFPCLLQLLELHFLNSLAWAPVLHLLTQQHSILLLLWHLLLLFWVKCPSNSPL